MKGTYGQFNYRKSARPDGDPIRAQGESIIQFASLLKKYTLSGDVDLAGSFSKTDAKGTFKIQFLRTTAKLTCGIYIK